MARYLVITSPLEGHIAPTQVVVRALVERGHDVRWVTGKRFQARVAAAVDPGDRSIEELEPRLKGLEGLAQLRVVFKHLFIDTSVAQAAQCHDLLASHPVDVIITEPTSLAAAFLHELGGAPYAQLNVSMVAHRSRDTAPFGLGMPPSQAFLGRLRNLALDRLVNQVLLHDVTRYLDAARGQLGLPPRRMSFAETLHEAPYLCLQGTVSEFEYPRSDLPPEVHFVGPLLPPVPGDWVAPVWWPGGR